MTILVRLKLLIWMLTPTCRGRQEELQQKSLSELKPVGDNGTYQEVLVGGGTADATVTSHCVQGEAVRKGAGRDAELQLQSDHTLF